MPIEVKNLFHTYLVKTPNPSEALKGISLRIEDRSFNAIIVKVFNIAGFDSTP